MRFLGEAVEERLYALETARGWKRSGLIAADQLSAIETALGALPTKAGWAIRLLFFGFAWTASNSLVSFLAWVISSEKTLGSMILLANAAASYNIAGRVVRSYNLYRFGVEEGLLFGALFQLCGAIFMLFGWKGLGYSDFGVFIGLAAALYCAWIYARFGYLYAAFGAVGALTFALVSQFSGLQEIPIRCAMAGLYGALLAATFQRRNLAAHDHLGWQCVQAALLLMICLSLNMRLGRLVDILGVKLPDGGLFYWSSFAAIIMIPAAALGWSVQRRHRPMLAASFIGSVIALVSVKPYLGVARHSWDPAVLGGAFMCLSLWLKRWLDSGPAGQRGGWTAKPLIIPRSDGPDMASLFAAAAVAGQGGGSTQTPQTFDGHGGSSGGAGASGGF
jgi:hypothetical protein